MMNPSFASRRDQALSQTRKLVSIKDRITAEIKSHLIYDRYLKDSVAILKQRISNKDLPSDPLYLNKHRGVYIQLGDIRIDTSFQRSLRGMAVSKMIREYNPDLMTPISIWIDPETQEIYAYDGQHRTATLHVILHEVYGLSLKDTAHWEMPCTMTPINMPYSKLVELYVHENKNGKEKLNPYDVYVAHVYGHRMHGITDPEYKKDAAIQSQLANNGLFLVDSTHEENESYHTGAITRAADVIGASLDTVTWFSQYMSKMMAQRGNKAVDKHELFFMLRMFFANCHTQHINITDAYIDAVVDINMSVFDGNFSDSGKFKTITKTSFANWKHVNKQMTERINCHYHKDGYHYLLWLYRRNFKNNTFKVPENMENWDYRPTRFDAV